MHLESLYLDYNATSPLSQSVTDWLRSGDFLFANPASQHAAGKASRKAINETRAQVFSTFNKLEKDHKLIFHSGATEGLHTVMSSFVEMARKEKRPLLVCYSKIDHPAVLALAERSWGYSVDFLELKLGEDLEYLHEENLKLIQAKKNQSPEMITLYHHLWVHNETGYVSPLKELSRFKQIPDLYLHIDAVQAPGKIADWSQLAEGDFWTFSAHKFGALKGVGFTLMKKEAPFLPLIMGGGQQFNLRSGTENVQGVMSLNLALKDVKNIDISLAEKKRDDVVAFLRQHLKGIGALVHSEKRLKNSNTIYFYLNHLTSDVALALFDLQGLQISAGSACSSGAAKESAILLQLKLKDVAKNGLRLSFNPSLKADELQTLKAKFLIILEKVKKA